MTRLAWRTDRAVELPPYRIPLAPDWPGAEGSGELLPWAGLRRLPPAELRWKRRLWPLYKALTDPLFDGYIEREALRLVHRHWRPGDTFLEAACGDMSLAGRLPAGACYNAFDARLSELHLRRLLARCPQANVALAPVERIPLPDACVDLLVCCQAFIHFRAFDAAVRELRRVLRPGGRCVCSLTNHFARLYRVRGPHPDGFHAWSYRGFVQAMAGHGFRLLEGRPCGLWLPLPRFLTQRALTLPVTLPREEDNLVFFCVFEAVDMAPTACGGAP
jgi:SAM-dependent methyltransferase